MLTIATWNVNSLRVRLAQVLDWLATHQPDVLALQETKLSDPEFPGEALAMAGYQTAFAGQKTYNGVAILAREPLVDVVTDLPGLDDSQRRVLGATVAGIRILNLYVPNGQSVDSDKYRYKLDWLDRLCAFVGEELQRHPALVVLGDFNIAPQDRDVHDPVAWAGKVLCSEPERVAFRRLLDAGLVDTFRQFEQPEHTFSWWDYRAAGFRRNYGLRIDHVLASRQLAERCRSCQVDRTPRKLERPSDHAPVVAVFD